jgi:hypothetical protein
MDTQVIEILGRNRLVAELYEAGLEPASPLRDRGVDLLAYLDLDDQVGRFVAVPIQMKAASKRSFSISRKYHKFSNLLLAYVWGLDKSIPAQTYALTYGEALLVADAMGYTKTDSWLVHGGYGSNNPSQRLLECLRPYLMTKEAWKSKIIQVSKGQL